MLLDREQSIRDRFRSGKELRRSSGNFPPKMALSSNSNTIFRPILSPFLPNRNHSSVDETTPAEVLIDPSDCSIGDNTITFQIILMMGIVFVSISALISLYIDKVDRKKLLSTRLPWSQSCRDALAHQHISHFSLSRFFIFFASLSWLAVDVLDILRFHRAHTAVLCDGHLLYDIPELRPVRRHY